MGKPTQLINLLALDQHSKVPIYAQIVFSLKKAIASGQILPAERLPTGRDIALHLKVNTSTVEQAYNEMEREGFLTRRRGLGTFVVETTPEIDPDIFRKQVLALAEQTVATAIAQGLDPAEVAATITLITNQKKSP